MYAKGSCSTKLNIALLIIKGQNWNLNDHPTVYIRKVGLPGCSHSFIILLLHFFTDYKGEVFLITNMNRKNQCD